MTTQPLVIIHRLVHTTSQLICVLWQECVSSHVAKIKMELSNLQQLVTMTDLQ